MDHLGPFIKTTKRNLYVLVIVDGFKKYVWLKVVKDTTTKLVGNGMKEFVVHFGTPTRVVWNRIYGESFRGVLQEIFDTTCTYCYDNTRGKSSM